MRLLSMIVLLPAFGCHCGGPSLDEIRCRDACAVGDTMCSEAGVMHCVLTNDGCLQFEAPQACHGSELCSGGLCRPAPCVDRCAVGAMTCSGMRATLECQRLATGCLDWGMLRACEGESVCVDGECVADAGCSSRCVGGQVRCFSGRTQRCIESTTGCTEWGPVTEACGSDGGSVPDGGVADGGVIQYRNGCPGVPYTPVCGARGAAWRKLTVPRNTYGLSSVWSGPGGDVFIGGTGIYRYAGGTFHDDFDAGRQLLGLNHIAGEGPNDLYAMSLEATDRTRLYHRDDAGWSQVLHHQGYGTNLNVRGGDVWVMSDGVLNAVVDGGLVRQQFPVGQAVLLTLTSDVDAGLWIAATTTPCSGVPDGGPCPRVIQGRPGRWGVTDFPCLAGSYGYQLWRRSPDELVFIVGGSAGGFMTRLVDAGWSVPERLGFHAIAMAGARDDAWILALAYNSQQAGVAHFSGCVEQPVWLYSSSNVSDPGCGRVSAVSYAAGQAWLAGGECGSQGGALWRGNVWTSP